MDSEETLGSAENEGPVGFWEDNHGTLYAGPFVSDDHLHYMSVGDGLVMQWSRSSAAEMGGIAPLRRIEFLEGMRRIGDGARIMRARIAALEAENERLREQLAKVVEDGAEVLANLRKARDDLRLWEASATRSPLAILKEAKTGNCYTVDLHLAAVRERLAAYAHDAWSRRMRHQLGRGRAEESDIPGRSRFVLMEEDVKRWERQMYTSYANLPEDEKKSDREEADRIIAILGGSK